MSGASRAAIAGKPTTATKGSAAAPPSRPTPWWLVDRSHPARVQRVGKPFADRRARLAGGGDMVERGGALDLDRFHDAAPQAEPHRRLMDGRIAECRNDINGHQRRRG